LAHWGQAGDTAQVPPDPDTAEVPPALLFLAQAKDSLWSVDLFRCESILLHSHWVLVVIDVFTRRIIGFGIERASIDGVSVCRMFNHAVAGRSPTHRCRIRSLSV
jgi:transposase InsO family protein